MATPKQLGARKRWINALRSGKFKQAKAELVSKDKDGTVIGYCCLGVLCELANEAGIIDNYNFTEYSDLNFFPEVREWVGLSGELGQFRKGDEDTSLAELNDGKGKDHRTFKQIAKVIKSNPKGLFTS